MGNQPSIVEALDEVQEKPGCKEDGSSSNNISLYKYRSDDSGNILSELFSTNISYKFYDYNEDKGQKQPQWHLEIAQANIDALVSEEQLSLQFNRKRGYRANFVYDESVFSMSFPSLESFQHFQKEYNDKIFENTYACEFDENGRKKVFGDMEGIFYPNEKTEENQVEEMDWEAQYPQQDKPPQSSHFRERESMARQDKIHAIKIGANNRSYVVRQGNLDVLNNGQDGLEDLNMGIKLKAPTQSTYLTPNKMILNKQERQANFLSPTQQSKVFQTDFEQEKIVKEWNFSKNGIEVEMSNIQNTQKASQLTDDDTFLSIGPKSINKWDMRTPKGIVQDLNLMDGKDYASRTNFTCIATTGDGYVAVGSLDGIIRLYSDKHLRRAITQVPGLGFAITDIDVSYDGRYVVATTDRFILVVITVFTDKKSHKQSNAFVQPGKSGMLPPKILKLRPEDQVKVGSKSTFQGAKFSWVLQQNLQEQHIVAYCGSYTLIWNFRQIKSSKEPNTSVGGLQTVMNFYKMLPRKQNIVDSHFLYDRSNGKGSSMVVATKNNIFSIGANNLDSDTDEEK